MQSFFWSAIERFGSVILTFVFNLILSRFFLTPADFGMLGMLSVFVVLANSTVVGGFGQALIQKNNPTTEDYSTVFIWNVVLAVIFYAIFYVMAPLISVYFKYDELCPLMRVLALTLIFNSLLIVQNNILIKNMNFKLLSKINIVATFLGYLIGVILAYLGYRVWSLVLSTLLIQLFSIILYWYTSTWRPSLTFSVKSFKELFAFGGFIYLTTLVDNLYSNISYFIIGKKMDSQYLGYFTQAEKLQSVPASTFSAVVNQVTFPLYSKYQNKPEQLVGLFKTNIKVVTLINSCIMFVLILIAKPLILLLFTNKWEASVSIMQLLCCSSVFLPVIVANNTIVKSLGKAKEYFVFHLLTKGLGILILIIISIINVNNIIIALCIIPIIIFFISVIMTSFYINYSVSEQMKDVFLSLITPFLVFISFYYLNVDDIFENKFITVFFILITYFISVVIVSCIIGDSSIIYLKSRILKIMKR